MVGEGEELLTVNSQWLTLFFGLKTILHSRCWSDFIGSWPDNSAPLRGSGCYYFIFDKRFTIRNKPKDKTHPTETCVTLDISHLDASSIPWRCNRSKWRQPDVPSSREKTGTKFQCVTISSFHLFFDQLIDLIKDCNRIFFFLTWLQYFYWSFNLPLIWFMTLDVKVTLELWHDVTKIEDDRRISPKQVLTIYSSHSLFDIIAITCQTGSHIFEINRTRRIVIFNILVFECVKLLFSEFKLSAGILFFVKTNHGMAKETWLQYFSRYYRCENLFFLVKAMINTAVIASFCWWNSFFYYAQCYSPCFLWWIDLFSSYGTFVWFSFQWEPLPTKCLNRFQSQVQPFSVVSSDRPWPTASSADWAVINYYDL